MTWLILGGNGQLGQALSFVLKERNIDFCTLASVDLDIRDAHSVVSTISNHHPKIIVNAAAWTDVDGAESNPIGALTVNAAGASNLALAARRENAILVQISTDYVFSGISTIPWRENDIQCPGSVYGETKAEGEKLILSIYPEGSYIFRTAWLYSKWGKNFAKTMTRLALKGNDPINVVSDQIGQPTSALDLSNQIVDAVRAGLPFGIYHATNSGSASWFEFARMIFELIGEPSSRVLPVSSNHFVRAANRPSYSVLSHDAWSNVGMSGTSVPVMRNWKLALEDAMPSIIATVKMEA